MDNDQITTDLENGIQSQVLLKNPVFNTAIEEIRKDFYEKWVSTDFKDQDNREELYHLKIALELVVSRIDSYIFKAENALAYKSAEEQPENDE